MANFVRDVVSAVAAASVLGVKPETLATWRSQGRGPQFLKIGRAIYYSNRALDEYLERCVHTPEPACVRRQRALLAAAGPI